MRTFASAQALALVADWIQLIALLALVYRLSGAVSTVALFFLARSLPRAVAALDAGGRVARLGGRLPMGTDAARGLFVASLALVDTSGDLWWAWSATLALSGLAAASDEIDAELLTAVLPRERLGAAGVARDVVARLCVVVGPLLAALVFVFWEARVAFLLAALLFLVAGALRVDLSRARRREEPSRRERRAAVSAVPSGDLLPRELRILASGLALSGAVAVGLQMELVTIAAAEDRDDATLGLLFASAGLGMLLGPLPVPRLLVRLSVEAVFIACALPLAVALAIVSQAAWLPLAAAVLIGSGRLFATNDLAGAIAIRRLAPETRLAEAARVMTGAIVAGQLLTATAVAGLTRVWSMSGVLLGVSVACAGLFLMVFVLNDGVAALARAQRRLIGRRPSSM